MEGHVLFTSSQGKFQWLLNIAQYVALVIFLNADGSYHHNYAHLRVWCLLLQASEVNELNFLSWNLFNLAT